jgi:uncharacterized membrane protein
MRKPDGHRIEKQKIKAQLEQELNRYHLSAKTKQTILERTFQNNQPSFWEREITMTIPIPVVVLIAILFVSIGFFVPFDLNQEQMVTLVQTGAGLFNEDDLIKWLNG